METKLRAMLLRHAKEREALRRHCPHPPHKMFVHTDGSGVGSGQAYPTILVTCKLCGKEKGYHGVYSVWAMRHKTILKNFGTVLIPKEGRSGIDHLKTWIGETEYEWSNCEE